MAGKDEAGAGGRIREQSIARTVSRAVSGGGGKKFPSGRTGASTPKSPKGPTRANPDLTPRAGKEGEGETAYGAPTADKPTERTGGKVKRPTARKDPLAVKKPKKHEGNPY